MLLEQFDGDLGVDVGQQVRLFEVDVAQLRVHHRHGRECHANASCRGCRGRRFFVMESLDLPETLGDESSFALHHFPAFSNFTTVQPFSA